jgi:ABC-type branched-subunit amino acid transport system ATPase component
MLAVEGVSAGYGRLEILHKVSLDVGPGEIVGIIGPNGAGKSTLLKTIFGYLPPFEGSIRFAGDALAGLSPDRVMRQGIGYVAQAGGVFADMSVHENLVLGGYSLGSRRAAAAAIERVYAQFPLFRARAHQRAGSLSGGEQRRSPSPARWSSSRASSSSTSRRLRSRHASSTRSMRRSPP